MLPAPSTCGANAETRVHFVVECNRLSNIRQGVHTVTERHFNNKTAETCVNEIIADPEKVTQLMILDSSVHVANGELIIDAEMTNRVEKISRNMCCELHKRRCDLLFVSVLTEMKVNTNNGFNVSDVYRSV